MTRKFGLVLGMVGTLVLVGACGSSSNTKPPIRLDGGGKKDTGGTPRDNGAGDTGAANDQTCTQLLSCAAKCNDNTCVAACVAKGTTKAQTDFSALDSCLTTAATGTCKADCTSATDPKCAPCLSTACKAEYDVCAGGTGQPDAGFGAKCDNSTPCTNSALTCITPQGAPNGFCTKPCTNSGQQCPGAPDGTAAFCIANTGTTVYCAFLCKAQGQQWDCPDVLVCSTTENPAGSGQFGCQ